MADDSNEPNNEHAEPDSPGETTDPSDANEPDGLDRGPDDQDDNPEGGVGAPTVGPRPEGDHGGAAATSDPDDEDAGGGESWEGSRLTASSNPTDGPSAISDRLIANETNASIFGVLRAFLVNGATVEMPMDGDAAVRSIACWRSKSLYWSETCDPVHSTAAASWAALDLDLVVGLLWLPGLPRERSPRRMTVDPAAA